MIEVNSQLICARELRQACLHEAAHEMLVMKFGGYATAHVWLDRSTDSKAGAERAWLGQVRMYAKPGEVSMTAEHCRQFGISPRPPGNWDTLVGLAGLVAECMGDGAIEAWEIQESIQHSFEHDEVSGTDAELIGERWTESDVEQVMTLLRDQWPLLQSRASQLEITARE